MPASIIDTARRYIEAREESERAELRPALDAYSGDFDKVVTALKPRPQKGVEKGWTISRPFRTPGLAGKYPLQPFALYVPPDYEPSKARGLLIWLHGGGKGCGDTSKHQYDNNPWLNREVEASGRIVCYPSAPPSDRCWARWHLPEADEYITDVITEIESLCNIDPDDVILGGHSMGGMGAIHMAHRFSDRFATVFAGSAHWDFAYWRCLMGTTLWLYHGVNDTTLFRRRHGTDIEFARLAKMRMEQAGVPCVYREHSGGHHLGDAIWVVREWLQWARDRRRDPFAPHVVAATPRGLTPWSDWRRHKVPLAAYENCTDFHSIPDAPHARWVTLDGVGPETVLHDMVVMSPCQDDVESDWNEFSLTLKRKSIPGGIAEARIAEDGAIEILPRNVTGVTLWLHPKMVDLNNVCVRVRGQERFRGAVKPSLAVLLDSYRRRRDWGMLYPAKVTIAADSTWETPDQLKIQPRY